MSGMMVTIGRLRETPIDIRSPVFQELLDNVDEKLEMLLEQLETGEFYGGDISIKISVESQDDVKHYDKITDEGKQYKEALKYKRPVIEHKTKLVLKKQSESKGSYAQNNMEMVKVDGVWILRELPDQQMKMEMEEEGYGRD
jgi:hypothetical protein